jgi:hypothetical protein
MWAVHASTWIADRLEIGIRYALLPLPDQRYSVTRDDRFGLSADPAARLLPRVDVTVENRSQRIVSGETIYHFARGRPARLFLGAGLGDKTHRYEQACAPAACESLMPILSSPVGRGSSHAGNLTAIAGVSGRIRRRLQVRAGIRLHNFGAEESSTSEAFIATGYRFGRD